MTWPSTSQQMTWDDTLDMLHAAHARTCARTLAYRQETFWLFFFLGKPSLEKQMKNINGWFTKSQNQLGAQNSILSEVRSPTCSGQIGHIQEVICNDVSTSNYLFGNIIQLHWKCIRIFKKCMDDIKTSLRDNNFEDAKWTKWFSIGPNRALLRRWRCTFGLRGKRDQSTQLNDNLLSKQTMS